MKVTREIMQRDTGDETTHDPEREYTMRQAALLDPVLSKYKAHEPGWQSMPMPSDPDRLAAGWANASNADKTIAEAQPAKNTDALLDTRGKTHGDYYVQTRIREGINQLVLENMAIPSHLTNGARHAIYMIATKLGRIAAGDPDFGDHWRDIAGYATLQADRCTKG